MIEKVYHDEKTLDRFHEKLMQTEGMTKETAYSVINAILNTGFLIRERIDEELSVGDKVMCPGDTVGTIKEIQSNGRVIVTQELEGAWNKRVLTKIETDLYPV